MFKALLALFSLGLSVSAFAADAPASASAPAADEAIKWSGEFHYRHEAGSIENLVPSSFHKHRLIARFGMRAPINPNLHFESRLATGTGGNSVSQTLGNGNNYGNYGIMLDRAFFDYHGLSKTHIYGGRNKNIFWLAGMTDLVFNPDLNFDGVAATTEGSLTDTAAGFANLGMFWVNQGSSANKDNQQISPQIGIKGRADTIAFGFSIAQHFFTHTAGQPYRATAGSMGNSVSGANYASDFHIWDTGLEVGTPFAAHPISVFGNYIVNSAVATEKTGYVAGFRFGKLGNPGDWGFAYDYRRLRRDATIGYYAEPQSGGGGTDISSHRLKAGIQAAKNLVAGTSITIGKGSMSTAPLRRNIVIVDLGFTF